MHLFDIEGYFWVIVCVNMSWVWMALVRAFFHVVNCSETPSVISQKTEVYTLFEAVPCLIIIIHLLHSPHPSLVLFIMSIYARCNRIFALMTKVFVRVSKISTTFFCSEITYIRNSRAFFSTIMDDLDANLTVGNQKAEERCPLQWWYPVLVKEVKWNQIPCDRLKLRTR